MYKIFFLILFIIVFLLTFLVYRNHEDVNWEFFIYWTERVQNLPEPQSITIMTIFVMLYIISIVFLLPFCGVLSILGGSLFGWSSFFLSMLSSIIGAFLVFHFLHNRFGKSIKLIQNKKIKKISTIVKSSQFLWLVFLRLLPILPFSIVSALSAQFVKRYRVFLLGTLIGSTPGLIAHTMIGIQIKNIIISDYERVVTFNVLLPVIFLCFMSLVALYFTSSSEENTKIAP